MSAKRGYVVAHVDGECVAVHLVDDGKLKGRIDVAFLAIAVHVDVLWIRAIVGELVAREDRVEVAM